MREREVLLENLIGRSKIDTIQRSIQPSEGGIVSSSMNKDIEAWIDQRFGQFGAKIVGVSDGAETLGPQEITAIGGWCAIRTADLMQLQQGMVVDPKTGLSRPYKEPAMVADWIPRAVSIDQIVETIGIYNGKNYVAISEEKLWGDRVKATVKETMGRRLTAVEKVQLEDATQVAETIRYECTKRYLEYVTGQDVNLMRVVDKDIYGDLVEVRNAMLDVAGISLYDLITQYPKEQTLKGYSIVWGMYTGPYLAMLKSKGYVQTQKGLIVEPWMHAVSETRAKRRVNQRVFDNNRNPYLKPGANQDLGYVAYADVMMLNGQRVRQTKPINGVPNKENYQAFIEQLRSNPNSTSVTLTENSAFLWGANLLPFGNTKDILYSMIALKEEYKVVKKEATSSTTSREEATSRAASIKDAFNKQMRMQADLVIADLEKMMQYVFDSKGCKNATE